MKDILRLLVCSQDLIKISQLQSAIRQVGDFYLLATPGTVNSLMEQVMQVSPTLILLDLSPGTTCEILRDITLSDRRIKVVLWVDSISTDQAFQAMELGVRGILRKNVSMDLQITCLQKVAEGELWFEESLIDCFRLARPVALTQREGKIVGLLAQGRTNDEIAAELFISEKMVNVYLSRLCQKIGAKDRAELALFGLKNVTL